MAGFHFGDVFAQYHVAAFTTITVCFKILSLFRGNSYATTFTRIIFRMMKDSRYVILIIFVNIVGFAVAFNMLYRGRMPNFVSVDSGLFSMFLAIFGQLDFVQVGHTFHSLPASSFTLNTTFAERPECNDRQHARH